MKFSRVYQVIIISEVDSHIRITSNSLRNVKNIYIISIQPIIPNGFNRMNPLDLQQYHPSNDAIN